MKAIGGRVRGQEKASGETSGIGLKSKMEGRLLLLHGWVQGR